MNKISVYLTFMTDYQTWNVIEAGSKKSLHFGTVESCDDWLKENKDTHIEVVK